MDVLVLGAFHRTVGGVGDVAEILYKPRVDAKHGVLVALGLHDVAYCQGAYVTAVLEIPSVERFQTNFVKNLAAFGPLRKNARGSCGRCARDEFVLVVLLGSPDDAVLNDILYDLRNLTLLERNVHDESGAVLGGILLAGGQSERGDREEQDCGGFPQDRSG